MRIRVFKRITAILLILTLFATLVSACANPALEVDPTFPEAFTCKAHIQYNQTNISANITRPNAASCRMEITEPANLKGMILDWNGSGVTVTYLGLSFDVNLSDMPDTAFANILIGIFNAMQAKNGLAVEKTDDTVTFKGDGENGQFSVIWDRKTNALKQIEIPSSGFLAQISDFQRINDSSGAA